MKNLLFILLFIVLFSSCSNDENVLFENNSKNLGAISFDSLQSLVLKEDLKNPQFSKQSNVDLSLLRSDNSSLNILSDVAWTRYVVRDPNRKVFFNYSENLPSPLAPFVTYIVDYVTVFKEVTLPEGTIGYAYESPDCGYHPYPSYGGEKGYVITSQNGTTLTMATYATLVKSDLNGRVYNVWIPKDPINFRWYFGYVYK